MKSITHLVGVFLVIEPGFPTRLALSGFFAGVTALLGVTAFAGVFEVVEGVIMRDFLELTRRVDFRRSPTALAALAADAAVGFIRELRLALLIRQSRQNPITYVTAIFHIFMA